jgi:transcriptional regulator with XRE-family HTH domain
MLCNRSKYQTPPPPKSAMMARTIGKAVRAAREARGLTLRHVAKAVGMSAPQLSSLESGKPGNPGWATVSRLAKALGMSLDEVAGLIQSKPLSPSLPRAVQKAIEQARKEVHKAAMILDELTDKLG